MPEPTDVAALMPDEVPLDAIGEDEGDEEPDDEEAEEGDELSDDTPEKQP